MELTLGLAFIAGLISFISPCVLPLVPAYIGYMGGRMTHTVAVHAGAGGGSATATPSLGLRLNTMLHSIAFVAGFTFVFVVLGLLSTAFIRQIGGQNISLVTNIIGRVGGVLIIFFGLHFMGAMNAIFNYVLNRKSIINNTLTSIAVAVVAAALIIWSFIVLWVGIPLAVLLVGVMAVGGAFTKPEEFWTNTINRLQYAFYADTRRDFDVKANDGLAGSALMGVVFSAGWTPCIGPVYGAVLTMAANGGNVSQAGVLLTAYSLGLGIPFMLTALLLDGAQAPLRKLQRHMQTIKIASGVFLIVIGVLIASGRLQTWTQRLANGQFSLVAIRLEECVLGVVNGEVGVGGIGDCMSEDAPLDAAAVTLSSPDELDPVDVPEDAAVNEAIDVPDGAVTDIIINPDENVSTIDGAAPGLITDLADDVEPQSTGGVSDTGTEIGALAPNFETTTDSGTPIQLEDLRGEVVLLNFWATWCGPCRIEMPEFEAAFQEHADDGFTIVAVNNRETVADVLAFREELDLSFPMVMDENGSIQDLYGVFSYPSTYVVDREGVIRARHFGPLTDEQIQELIAEALS